MKVKYKTKSEFESKIGLFVEFILVAGMYLITLAIMLVGVFLGSKFREYGSSVLLCWVSLLFVALLIKSRIAKSTQERQDNWALSLNEEELETLLTSPYTKGNEKNYLIDIVKSKSA